MTPVRYVDYTRAAFAAQGFPPYEWLVNGTPPFTPFDKALKECRVALLSTGGFYVRGKQAPFDPEKNDMGFREIPKDVDVSDLTVSHNYYDHSDAERDVNCVFPIERLRELEVEGYIGGLAPVNYTIMGRIFRRTTLVNETAREIAEGLKRQEADVFFLVPA